MAKKIKKSGSGGGEDRYRKQVRKKLSALLPVFASASIGDFSRDVKIPKKRDEFTEVYVGIQIMIDVVREKIAMLEEINRSLEHKVRALNLALNDEIFVGSKGRLVKINTRDILFVKAVGDYVIINTSAAERHMVHSTMKGMLEKLPSEEFFRVHHSYIVRLDKITEKQERSVLVGETLIPVSRANRKELGDRLKRI
ncbi:MAG: LytTR family DNA-binding domain-containing protein [Bacteroidota bacterium]